QLTEVIPAKGGVLELNGPDTRNHRSNDDVGGLGQLLLPHSWNINEHPNSYLTLLLEELHRTSHLKKERKVNRSRAARAGIGNWIKTIWRRRGRTRLGISEVGRWKTKEIGVEGWIGANV
ncbi:hypothetical protein HAX54_003322, partial [Datura stramonium]|nr:hypothetical protein [Datura stramonium]